MSSVKLALVTSSQRLQDAVQACFAEDHEVVRFCDDQALIRALGRVSFSAIVIDTSDSAGMQESRSVFASRNCQSKFQAPLILVGHFTDRAALDQAFAAGADDIVRLPLDADELYARTHRAIRRAQADPSSGEMLVVASYKLNKRLGIVTVDGLAIQLTPREFAIAWMLFSRPGQYLSRGQIAVAVWGCSEEVAGRTLEQHVYKLRKKLLLSGNYGARLSTQYAHGYRIEAWAAECNLAMGPHSPESTLAHAAHSMADITPAISV